MQCQVQHRNQDDKGMICLPVCLSTKHSMHSVATVTREQHVYSIEMGGGWLHVHDLREGMCLVDGYMHG